jgi:hypothetical protein
VQCINDVKNPFGSILVPVFIKLTPLSMLAVTGLLEDDTTSVDVPVGNIESLCALLDHVSLKTTTERPGVHVSLSPSCRFGDAATARTFMTVAMSPSRVAEISLETLVTWLPLLEQITENFAGMAASLLQTGEMNANTVLLLAILAETPSAMRVWNTFSDSMVCLGKTSPDVVMSVTQHVGRCLDRLPSWDARCRVLGLVAALETTHIGPCWWPNPDGSGSVVSTLPLVCVDVTRDIFDDSQRSRWVSGVRDHFAQAMAVCDTAIRSPTWDPKWGTPVIAGGSVAWMAKWAMTGQGHPTSPDCLADIDIFTPVITDGLLTAIGPSGSCEFQRRGAVTTFYPSAGTTPLQLIPCPWGFPESVISAFDMSHCKAALRGDGTLIASATAVVSWMVGITWQNPWRTPLPVRIVKAMERGYKHRHVLRHGPASSDNITQAQLKLFRWRQECMHRTGPAAARTTWLVPQALAHDIMKAILKPSETSSSAFEDGYFLRDAPWSDLEVNRVSGGGGWRFETKRKHPEVHKNPYGENIGAVIGSRDCFDTQCVWGKHGSERERRGMIPHPTPWMVTQILAQMPREVPCVMDRTHEFRELYMGDPWGAGAFGVMVPYASEFDGGTHTAPPVPAGAETLRGSIWDSSAMSWPHVGWDPEWEEFTKSQPHGMGYMIMRASSALLNVLRYKLEAKGITSWKPVLTPGSSRLPLPFAARVTLRSYVCVDTDPLGTRPRRYPIIVSLEVLSGDIPSVLETELSDQIVVSDPKFSMLADDDHVL